MMGERKQQRGRVIFKSKTVLKIIHNIKSVNKLFHIMKTVF